MIIGKTKLLKLVNELLNKAYKLKECNYEKYKKSEWLKTENLHIFKNSNTLLIDFLYYDEETSRDKSANTVSYYFNGEEWIKQYDRKEMLSKYKGA